MKCQFCNKSFNNKGSLKSHERFCFLNPEIQKPICKYCNKEFDNTSKKYQHEYRCSKNPKNIHENTYIKNELLYCQYCNKECHNLNSLRQHEIRCKNNPDRKDYNKLGNYSHDNFKGQSKDTNSVIAKQAATLKKRYDSGDLKGSMTGRPGTFLGRKHTEQSKRLIGEHVSKSRKEGYACGRITPAEGIGRGKYSYIITPTHKYMLRSTYEFIFALYLIYIKKISFEIEAIKVPALRKNGYAETFISDFSIGNTIIEIKGIASGKDYYIKESFEAVGYTFIELFEDSILQLKEELIINGINIDYLLKQVIEGHNSKNYFIYDISNS